MNWLIKTSQDDYQYFLMKVRLLAKNSFPVDLFEEIEYQLDITKETIDDEIARFGEADTITESPGRYLEEILSNILYSDPQPPRKWIVAIYKWEINNGIYREISSEEMDRTQVSHGKKYDFKMNGKYYVFNKHLP